MAITHVGILPELFQSELTLSASGFLFDHQSGLTYTLNSTGQFIFQKMQEGLVAADIIQKLIQEFDITEDIARKDLDDFLRQLTELGLLRK